MSIRYTLRHLKEGECTLENLKKYELAVSTTNGRIVFRLGDVIQDLTGEASTGAIEASRMWATSEDSPDEQVDLRSPTGKTMSSRSWALAMIDDANEALTAAETAMRNAQSAAQTATNKAQEASQTAQQINTKIQEVNAVAQQVSTTAQQVNTTKQQVDTTAQQINASLTTVNQRLQQSETNLQQSTVLLNRLIDITDADEVRY